MSMDTIFAGEPAKLVLATGKSLLIYDPEANGFESSLKVEMQSAPHLARGASLDHVIVGGGAEVLTADLEAGVVKSRAKGRFNPEKAGICAITTLPNGTAVTGHKDGQLRAWDVAQGKLKRGKWKVGRHGPGWLICVDDTRLIVPSGKTLQLWDIGAGTQQTLFAPDQMVGFTTEATFSKELGLLAFSYGTHGRAGTQTMLEVIDISDGKSMCRVAVNDAQYPQPLAYTRGGELILLHHGVGRVANAVGETRRYLRGLNYGSAVSLDPEGRWLCSVVNQSVRTSDLHVETREQEETRWRARHGAWVQALARRGGEIVSAGDQTVKRWDAESGAFLGTLRGMERNVQGVVFSDDDEVMAGDYTESIRVWKEGRTHVHFPAGGILSDARMHDDGYVTLVDKLSSRGAFIASFTRTGRCTRRHRVANHVHSWKLSSDGTSAVALLPRNDQHLIVVFDTSTGKALREWPTTPVGGRGKLLLSHDETRVAAIAANGATHVYDLSSGDPIASTEAGSLVAAFSPRSRDALWIAKEDKLVAWSVDGTSRELASIPGDANALVAWDHSCAIGTLDGTVKVLRDLE